MQDYQMQKADVTIKVPSSFSRFTEQQRSIQITAIDLESALIQLTEQYPRLKNQLFTTNGQLRSFIKVFLNHDDVDALNNQQKSLSNGDKITIVPAIAGG